jgi:hypothetical protein
MNTAAGLLCLFWGIYIIVDSLKTASKSKIDKMSWSRVIFVDYFSAGIWLLFLAIMLLFVL